ncbi:hypothetical protein [Candidatus Halobonum tyrrellensis]|uniref:hypothetical protein n=1 Tax=Candidatus Halobonum tyrrellensis TaxID=1431545 RepID=UPI000677779A|nr:hypothetical protein [Candidatus Halobonum tyrrellensis]
MSSDLSTRSTDAGATRSTDERDTRSDGLVAFGALLAVITLLGVLSKKRRRGGVWRRDPGSTPLPESNLPESTVASSGSERPGV